MIAEPDIERRLENSGRRTGVSTTTRLPAAAGPGLLAGCRGRGDVRARDRPPKLPRTAPNCPELPPPNSPPPKSPIANIFSHVLPASPLDVTAPVVCTAAAAAPSRRRPDVIFGRLRPHRSSHGWSHSGGRFCFGARFECHHVSCPVPRLLCNRPPRGLLRPGPGLCV